MQQSKPHRLLPSFRSPLILRQVFPRAPTRQLPVSSQKLRKRIRAVGRPEPLQRTWARRIHSFHKLLLLHRACSARIHTKSTPISWSGSKYGDHCMRSHDLKGYHPPQFNAYRNLHSRKPQKPKSKELCRNFLRFGRCGLVAKCKYQHISQPMDQWSSSSPNSSWPCSFWLGPMTILC